MAKTSGPRTGLTRWSAGTDAVARLDFDSDNADLDANVMLYKQGTLAARPAAGTTNGGRIYTVVGDGTAENNRKMFYDTGSTWITAGSYGTDVLNESSAAGNQALIARGVSGQTADIFAVRNNSAANLFRVTADGIATNQTTVGTSPGGYLGAASSHLAAGLFNSVATNKPVLVAKAMAGQASSVLSVQDDTGGNLFKVDPGGTANLSGALTVGSATVTGSLTVNSINNTGGSVTLKNIVATPNTTGDSPLVARGLASQTGNLFSVQDSASTTLFRVAPDGSLSTSGKIKVGNGAGADTGGYGSSSPAAQIDGGGLAASTTVLRVVGGSGSTSNLFDVRTSTGDDRFAVTNAGNSILFGNASSGSGYFGSATGGTPTQINGTTYTPKLEVLTGTEPAAFDDLVVLRHSATGTGVFERRVGMAFKLGDESSSSASALQAAIGAKSLSASSANPVMYFRVGNVSDAATLDAAGIFSVTGRLNVTPATTGEKLRMYSTEAYGMGVQSSTLYARTGSGFAWYKGGTFSATQNDPGAGGTLLMDLDSGGRLTVGRINATATPTGTGDTGLAVGPLTGVHLHVGVNTIDSFASNAHTTGGNLYLQFFNTSGSLVLGSPDTQVRLDSRTLWTGANRVYWGNSTWSAQGGGPIPNDWWFDYTNNQIKVRNDLGQWKIVADDAAFA